MKQFILDEEINLLESQGDDGKGTADLLNTMSYVDTLTECVMNAPADKTFNIGLFGEWGSGKSSIIRTFKGRIQERYQHEGKKVMVITYDAWKYANDSFRRMFLLQMQQELGFERNELMNKFYLNSSEDAHIDTRFDWKTFLIGAAIVLAVVIGIVKFTNFSSDGKILATAIVSLCSLGYTIIHGLFREVKVNIQRPHLFAPEQFEECFNEMCEKARHQEGKPLSYLKWINGEKGESGIDRLVIVIDNVDRCSSELAYELLTNIKNFLGCKHNTVFIIPVDEGALKRHFEPKNTDQQDDSAEFLRKFFNICIRIKPFKRDEMFDFADAINKKHALGYEPTTVSLVANEFAHNPRRIIQMFNNLSVELQSLPEEYDKKYQALVCMLLIIREEYPSFYNALQKEPLGLLLEEKRTDATDEVKEFLALNSAVIDAYGRNVFVIEHILSNTPLEDKVPQTVKNEYLKMSFGKESLDYIADAGHRKSLMHYVENRLKTAIKRHLWQTDVKNNVDRLLALNNTIHLKKEENLRLAGMLTSHDTFDEIAERQPNLHQLIDYAAQLEKQGISSIANSLVNYIKEKGVNGEEYQERVEVWYACHKLSDSQVKKLAKVTLAACKKDIKSIVSQDYEVERAKLVYSDDIINHLFSKMSSNEDDVVNLIQQIASKISLAPAQLAAFVKALNDITPKYDYAKKNTQDLLKRLVSLNQILPCCQQIRTDSEETKNIKEFYSKYTQTTVVSTGSRSGQRAFILDNLAQPDVINEVLDFFHYASLITGDSIVPPETLNTILETKNHDEKIVEIIYDIQEKGYPIEIYSEPVFKISTYSDKHLALIEYLLKKKNTEDKTYYIEDSIVNRELEKLLTYILGKANDEVSAEVQTIQRLVSDARNAEVFTSLLAGKDKDWLLSLPKELMGYALSVFAGDIENYKNQLNVMQLLASKGDSKVRKAVVRIANAKINDEQQRVAGMAIIKSFETLSASDAKPLITSLEFIKDGKPEIASEVDDCLKHLEAIKPVKKDKE